jgi:hypothetical protein
LYNLSAIFIWAKKQFINLAKILSTSQTRANGELVIVLSVVPKMLEVVNGKGMKTMR